MLEQLVAHTRFGNQTLADADRGPVVWRELRAALPDALAVVVGPDHVHCGHEPGAQKEFARALRRVENRFPDVRFDLAPPERYHGGGAAARMIRYILRNPVQHGWVDDPFAWPWSTLRDLAGAVADPWVDLTRLSAALRKPSREIPGFMLQIEGRPIPRLRRDVDGLASIEDCVAAVAAAHRTDPSQVLSRARLRRVLVHLADRVGDWTAPRLAQATGCSPRSICRDRAVAPPPGLPAALLCLSDPRLRGTKVAYFRTVLAF